MDNQPKKRGRPATLTPEEKEARRIEKNRRDNERKKAGGWTAQKKYQTTHKRHRDTSSVYEVKIRVPLDKKEEFKALLEQTGLSITKLCLDAIEEKYGVVLLEPLDKSEKE